MNTNFKVIGLTRVGIKPKFTVAEADALITQPSELLFTNYKSNLLFFTNYKSEKLSEKLRRFFNSA